MPKQVIVLRKDLNMRKGKMVAQGAHASIGAILNLASDSKDQHSLVIPLNDDAIRSWLLGSFKKVCVGVQTESELSEIYIKARNAGLPCSFIIDSGLTEFNGMPTATACAVGPGTEEDVDKITGHLKLL
jgi:PTH2 family peptidyl-tRNA hydrolase